MLDRHSKWVRVEPGTVIPAGQPYRIEYPESAGFEKTAKEFRGSSVASPVRTSHDVFIDSSWKPPLVLPSEPTWGIAVAGEYDPNGDSVWVEEQVGMWHARNGEFFGRGLNQRWTLATILDFIPLTDEQVARIEAAQ